MNRALRLTGTKQDPRPEFVVNSIEELPVQGDTLVRIAYSSLNYKDGLAITGKGKIVRSSFPFVPGIDLVGEVVETTADGFFPGDWVIGTGWGIGEDHWGGYSQNQWMDAKWLVPLAEPMNPIQAMTAGTAGLTAMIAVDALEHNGLEIDDGPVLVSGASGGVGSFAVAILSGLGYEVVASTGKQESHEYLKRLGAARIIDRSQLSDGPKHALESAQWAGAVDSVGSGTLATIIAQLQRHGSVAVCGLAGGHSLDTTVFPLILRGVNLLGVDSNTCPNDHRTHLWERLAGMTNEFNWGAIGQVIKFDKLVDAAEQIVAGKISGRIVVDVNG